MYRSIKNFLLGAPLETEKIHEEKLPKWKALAVFSSDALSSVAYATQEILIPLTMVGMAATAYSLPIALCIGCLLLIVSLSYWQTLREYPTGGGAYIVAKENLGTNYGLMCGAAILIDYILTVAVSVAAGMEAVTSAVPLLYEYHVVLGCFAIALITLINLRGIRESANVFALPTYMFIFSIIILMIGGLYGFLTGHLVQKAPIFHETYPEVSLMLLLRAFASGCAALTGIEAISDGVPAFKKPESRNAQITLIWMVAILGSFFLGITILGHLLGLGHAEGATETLISQIAREVFGGGWVYFLIQASTALILMLAANTSYADFPRVCSLLGKDRFLPRQMASLGDRLVFSKGIFLLGLISAGLLILFRGTTHYLIPLYAVGVFLSFTLSQAGMVRHHLKKREKGWRLSVIFSAMGAFTTFIVLLVIGYTKFSHGAWIVVLLIPLLVMWFRSTHEHYRRVGGQLALRDDFDFKDPIKHVVVLPVSGVHRGVIDAIKYAKSISHDVRVVYVELDEEATNRMRQAWAKLKTGLELTVLESPYRSVIGPIVDYIRRVDVEADDDMLTVVIPEFVTARWWHGIYHNQTAFLIKTALLFERGKVVTSVRYHLSR